MNTHSQTSSVFQREAPIAHPFPSSNQRIRIAQHNSDWMEKLNPRFNELTSLPIGWDGYIGQPVSFTCASFAANLIERLYLDGIPAPQLVPGNDGSVQIEWHLNNYDIEIDVLAPYKVIATRFDNISGREDEDLEFQSDFTTLADWVKALMAVRDQVNTTEA